MSSFIQTLRAEFRGHGVHTIEFRPGEVGQIAIAGHIANPMDIPGESPFHEIVFSLVRPGQTAPLVSRHLIAAGQTPVSLDYTITATDLVPAGNWTCQIQIMSASISTIAATVTYPTGWPIRAASFDLELLNLLIREALKVAQPRVHLQSSDDRHDKQSQISWSAAATAFLGEPLPFYVGDVTVPWHGIDLSYKVVNLDTQDITASMSLGAPPELEIHLSFVTSGAQLQGTFDVELRSLTGALQLHFDGSLSAQFSASAHTSALNIDESITVADGFASHFQGITSPANVRAKLDKFFAGLLRFDPIAVVTGYGVASGALIVSYAQPELVLGFSHGPPSPFESAAQEGP